MYRNDSCCTQVKELEEQSRKLASGTLGTSCHMSAMHYSSLSAPPLLNNMEDDVPERAFYFEALESCSLTSADSKEDICVVKDTNKTRAQEQWQKIRCSVPFLLRLNLEAVR